ncbi:helix-turn-helix domain-containing protein [Fibrella forsythiae]|uniref:Helix-turn-helix transcriptional regulator n=1 Tax=Fibrella forsythiae TaxID=2817061 RepID=A0ABS3JF52_9BACT|nr:AraC family transcriptional regulator [Fibrella forsythiae]MBO0948634.1 helix-turn-helix transcriptional regulator [Fibrella forsythiae]
MNNDDSFPSISPGMARERFLIKDEAWEQRFRPDFNQFIIAPFEFARPVIKLPVPPGRTGNHALFLLTGGQVELSVGHRAYTLSAQQVTVIPAGQIFSITAIREDTTGFMCFFSNDLLISTIQDISYNFLKLTTSSLTELSAQQTGFLTGLMGRLVIDYSESGASRTDIIRPYLLAVLSEINRAYAGTVAAKTDAGDRLVQGFIHLLEKYIRQKAQVTDYADLLHVSPNHLNKVIKLRTGQSPSVWIDERRVLEAKVLLFQSTLTIGQIAAELGFTDQSSFGRLFRKYADVSPAQFRKMIDSAQSLPGMA